MESHVEITQIVRAVSRILKRYHGCGRINRSGTRKLIDYKTGERCLVSTNQRCWRKNRKTYATRRRIKLLKCLKNFHSIARFE